MLKPTLLQELLYKGRTIIMFSTLEAKESVLVRCFTSEAKPSSAIRLSAKGHFRDVCEQRVEKIRENITPHHCYYYAVILYCCNCVIVVDAFCYYVVGSQMPSLAQTSLCHTTGRFDR